MKLFNKWADAYFNEMPAVVPYILEICLRSKSLAVPNLVVNPVGCSCIGPEDSDRTWQRASLYGALDLH